jgi:hypothetical protein
LQPSDVLFPERSRSLGHLVWWSKVKGEQHNGLVVGHYARKMGWCDAICIVRHALDVLHDVTAKAQLGIISAGTARELVSEAEIARFAVAYQS